MTDKEIQMNKEKMDFMKIKNFIDWFAPSKKVNDELQEVIKDLENRLLHLEQYEGWTKK